MKNESVVNETKWTYVEQEKLTLKVMARDWWEFLTVFTPIAILGAVIGFGVKYSLDALKVFDDPTDDILWGFLSAVAVCTIIIQTILLTTKSGRI